jgi:transcriptional regulator with XRE-family HTH domain
LAGFEVTLIGRFWVIPEGEIEKRSGLLRCYISRVENGHTVPAIPTLEKLARAYSASYISA